MVPAADRSYGVRRMQLSRLIKLIAAGSIAVGAAVLASGTAMAGAAPSKAPSAISGTFSCTTTAETGTFVVNNGHSTATTWSVAHLTFSTGGKANLVPSAFHFAFVKTVGGTATVLGTTTAVKGNGHAPSPNTCHITAVVGVTPTTSTTVFLLTGTVDGKLVSTKH